MNAMSPLPSRLSLLALALACCLPLASCSSTHNNDVSNNGQYATYGADGHYNPYPNNPSGKPNYKYQEYNDSSSGGKFASASSDEEEKPAVKKKKTSSSTSSSSGKKKKKTTHSSKSDSDKSDKPSSSKSKSSTKHKTSSKSNRYTVKDSDTLYSIAKKHHTTVSKIKKLNDLESSKIHGGQKLKLPSSS
jgi:LysM repeat protein